MRLTVYSAVAVAERAVIYVVHINGVSFIQSVRRAKASIFPGRHKLSLYTSPHVHLLHQCVCVYVNIYHEARDLYIKHAVENFPRSFSALTILIHGDDFSF